MKFLLVKKGIYLIPATDADKEKFCKVGQGEFVQGEFNKKRNYKFLQKFFVLINIGFENQDFEKNIGLYREKVMIQVGCCDTFFLDNGQINFKAKSISYDAIPDDQEFERIYNLAVDHIANKLSMTNEELAAEVATHF